MPNPLRSACLLAGLLAAPATLLAQGHPAAPAAEPLDWKSLEAPLLAGHVQITHRRDFTKAGEAYFSPDGEWIVFQAIQVPSNGGEPDPFYSMYVAKLTRDASGNVTGTEKPILVSAPGSANTCGWFHPTEPWRVLFGSTVTKPAADQRAGFQVGTRKYVWMFPEEMEVCTRTVAEMLPPVVRAELDRKRQAGEAAPADLDRAVPMFSRPDYDAECSYTSDGRFVLYAHVREPDPNATEEEKAGRRADADLWIYDTRTGAQHAIVVADGYDGGPFFSPDGKRICYRSDRKLNDLLQLFVADLKFDAEGVPVGIEREYQVTDNSQVNWAPYWHPSGKFLVYGTSEVSHGNYEVFAVEIDDAKLKADGPTSRAAETLRRKRITSATGADVLPVFNRDGSLMMWTAQRGPMAPGEQRPSSQLWIARFNADAVKFQK